MNLLFWLSLMPFATKWVGENNFDKISVVVYATLLLVSGLSYYILQQAIVAHDHFHDKMMDALNKQSKKELFRCSPI